jgi:predicted RNase H-like HicB family nuclease
MKKLKKGIDVTIEKTDTGYSAFADDLNVFTTAKDIASLHKNLIEGINLYYEEKGIFIEEDNIRLHLDLKQFFRYYKVLNAKFLACRIGMNPTLLSQYVRGNKRPSSKQINKIIKGIQSIGKELMDIELL